MSNVHEGWGFAAFAVRQWRPELILLGACLALGWRVTGELTGARKPMTAAGLGQLQFIFETLVPCSHGTVSYQIRTNVKHLQRSPSAKHERRLFTRAHGPHQVITFPSTQQHEYRLCPHRRIVDGGAPTWHWTLRQQLCVQDAAACGAS